MNASVSRVAGLVLLMSAVAACKPEPPPLEQPPEPKAATATELRDAIKRPIDQAKAVEAATQEAAEKQRAAIDAATH